MATAGDGQVSFEEFAKLVMSLAAPQQQHAGGYGAGTGLMGTGRGAGAGVPPHFVGAGVGAGAYFAQGLGGYPGGLPPPAAAMPSTGNPVQAWRGLRAARGGCSALTASAAQDMETFQRMNALDADALRRIYHKFQEVDQARVLLVAARGIRARGSCAFARAVEQERTGMVDVNEFCRLLRVERSPFVERLFSMFDTDRGGLIDLKEFIVGACCWARTALGLHARTAACKNAAAR